jgi:pyruvate formate lyase activating enzyme
MDTTHCTGCQSCVEACLGRALRYYGREITVDEARRVVLEDRDFYGADGGIGGGATLSGGEPLLQDEFCAGLFRRLRADGIHCAIDTSGAVAWLSFEKVLPWTDMFLYDVKHVDERLHRRYTGLTNRRIIENLRRLAESHVPIEIRVPIIPQFNDDGASIEAIAGLLADLRGVVGLRLLPYHRSDSKYGAVGLVDNMAGVDELSTERLQAIAARFEELLDLSRIKLYASL